VDDEKERSNFFHLIKSGRIVTSILLDWRYTFLFFFGIAFLVRAITWFFIPVDWNWDSYHHWQIAYYTLHIGLKQGRMWDLTGMEYFWGVFPHLVEAFIMWVLHTSSIIPYRVFNMIIGSLTVYLVYLIGRDNIYYKVGLYAALFAAFCPILAIFDIIAMQDTLALFLTVLGIYLYRRRWYFSGFVFGLACQSRIELWIIFPLFLVGVLILERFRQEERGKMEKFPFILGWLSVMIPFTGFFWTKTGNPIYPLYYSLYNTFGGFRNPGSQFIALISKRIDSFLFYWPKELIPVKTGFIIAGVVSLVILIRFIRKPPKGYHIYCMFFASVFFQAAFYLAGNPWYHKIYYLLIMARMFNWIILFGCIAISRVLLDPRIARLKMNLIFLLFLVLSFLWFIPMYQPFQKHVITEYKIAEVAASFYQGGTILSGYPTLNYHLINTFKIKAKNILSHYYTPLYYGIYDKETFIEWFRDHNVTLWIQVGRNSDVALNYVMKNIPELLTPLNTTSPIPIYRVNPIWEK